MDVMVSTVERLLHEIAELKLRVANAVQVGPVAESDAEKGYRVALGVDRDGEPRLSPWLPHPDSGGGNKSWRPLTKGQIVAVMAPGGEVEQGFILRAGFGGEDPPPSQDLGEVVVLDNGGVRISATKESVVITVGGTKLTLTADGIGMDAQVVAITGDSVTHQSHEIGYRHVHTQVMNGLGRSGPPP